MKNRIHKFAVISVMLAFIGSGCGTREYEEAPTPVSASSKSSQSTSSKSGASIFADGPNASPSTPPSRGFVGLVENYPLPFVAAGLGLGVWGFLKYKKSRRAKDQSVRTSKVGEESKVHEESKIHSLMGESGESRSSSVSSQSVVAEARVVDPHANPSDSAHGEVGTIKQAANIGKKALIAGAVIGCAAFIYQFATATNHSMSTAIKAWTTPTAQQVSK